MLTAAVRELHRHYPGRFLTDTRTLFPELWAHNPHVVPLEDGLEVETLGCDSLFVARSGQIPSHYIHSFLDFLNRRLDLRLEIAEFRGDVYLSDRERAMPSVIQEVAGKDAPYWVICAGGKHDITIKWWAAERYQKAVDHFRGRIQFVQVGQRGHFHPRLEGTMDLRGRTDLRQLIRLIYHAEGVVCGVTSLMHLAAAVPVPPNRPGLRPCVVIAGGREPPHWEAYPGHQFIHTVGALECCRHDGCWKSRTRALGDGEPEDEPEKRCVAVLGDLPRCMHLIRAEEVIRRIEIYLEGGRTRRLRPAEAQVARRAVKLAGPSGFEHLPLTLSSARLALEAFLEELPRPNREYHGRGIVICAGGARYFTNAWICITSLRRLGCQLPVQVWYLGRGEMDPEMEHLLHSLKVQCVDATRVREKHPVRRIGCWEGKAFALLHCSFREVLLLDADNLPLRDPTFLFDTPEFAEAGALFWPDRGRSPRSDPIWRSCDLEVPREPEFESGQIVVDKHRCWPALRLALWFNEHSDFYYRHIHGDKDTFSLAFRRLKTPYRQVPHPPEPFLGGVYQHDFRGLRLFQHRMFSKWTLMPRPASAAVSEADHKCLADLQELRTRWDGRMAWLKRKFPGKALRKGNAAPAPLGVPSGDLAAFMITCPERKKVLEDTLQSLSATDWPDLPLEILVDQEVHKDRVRRISSQVGRALQRFLEHSAGYMLLLEDDLIFNRHLRYNVERWPPFLRQEITLAGLCNGGIAELAYNVPENAVAVVPEEACGTQALLISRAAAEHAINGWGQLESPADLRLMSLVAQLGRPLLYHAPSLVQHRMVPSTRGAATFQVPDFDPEWRA
jgi:hypothetical protein